MALLEKEFFVNFSSSSSDSDHYIHLAKDIDFYSDWKVGLSSLTIGGDFKASLKISDRKIFLKYSAESDWDEFELPDVSYNSLFTLIEVLNNFFVLTRQPYTNVAKVRLTPDSKLLVINVKAKFDLKFCDYLSDFLGIKRDFIINKNFATYFSQTTESISPHFSILLDIIEDSILNNLFLKNLRLVPFSNDWEDSPQHFSFNPVQFYNVTSKQFSQLHFKLSQIAGTNVEIISSELIGTLHFIKK